MVAAADLSKDPKRVDLPLLFSAKDQELLGSAIASLIDADFLTNEQLGQIIAIAPDDSYKAMAAGELNHRRELKDRTPLLNLLNDDKAMVRYYAAMTLLDGKDPSEISAALEVLKKLTQNHELRDAPVAALMLVRAQKDNIVAAAPWAAQVAGDSELDEGLRYTAVSTLLALKGDQGPRLLAEMIEKQQETIQQVKLGLIATEFASQLKPQILEPLVKSRSTLAKTIGLLAQKSSEGSDNLAGLLALLKEGHPIVLDWALAYAQRTDPDRRLAIRTVLVGQATLVDGARERDFDRAADAAQKILDDDGPAGRKTVMGLLKSDNRAVVEAVLAGIYGSNAENQSELVMPIWDGLTKTSSTETAANYAALILARDGRKEPLVWLPGMVAGGTVQGQKFRTLAGWYYAKLQGQTAALVNYAIAN